MITYSYFSNIPALFFFVVCFIPNIVVLKQENDLNETIKNTDMLCLVGAMKSIKNQAEEIFYKE